MKAIRVADFDEMQENGPGAFYYRFDESGKPTHISFIVPNAVKDPDLGWFGGRGNFGGGWFGEKGNGWGFDGNLDSPTVTGSFWVNSPHGWHGFLRNGEWVDA